MLFNKWVYICMILGSLISRISSTFYDKFEPPQIMNFSSYVLRIMISMCTFVLTKLVVPLLTNPHQAIVFSLETICCLGLPNRKIWFLGLVPKKSIEVWLILLLKHIGFTIYFLSFITHHIGQLFFMMTMWVQFTCILIWFNTRRPNILR